MRNGHDRVAGSGDRNQYLFLARWHEEAAQSAGVRQSVLRMLQLLSCRQSVSHGGRPARAEEWGGVG